jgi:hypothetical protein
MEAITPYLPYIIQAVAGAVGGGGLGAIIKGKSLGMVGNLIAGAVGGLAAGQGATYGGLMDQIAPLLGGNAMAADGVVGLVGGGVLQVIASLILGKKA